MTYGKTQLNKYNYHRGEYGLLCSDVKILGLICNTCAFAILVTNLIFSVRTASYGPSYFAGM